MGCFDSVMVPCPCCGTDAEFQSKGGDCLMRFYFLGEDDIPEDVMSDVNRHSPTVCENCGTSFMVERIYRAAKCPPATERTHPADDE